MSLLSRISKSAYGPATSLTEIPNATPYMEVGSTGLLRTKGLQGIVYEEWLAQLSSYRQRQVYREMRDNDAGIGAMFFALEMILRRAEWSVEASKASKQGEQYAQFVWQCMDDMSHSWDDFIAETVSMCQFGFSLFETVYKCRRGSQTKAASSNWDDGLIGWRKLAPRSQESILYWAWDDEGGLKGAQQLAAPDYHLKLIPIESLLLFRTTSIKNNPEGRSLLRNCFRSWTFKKRLEEVCGIGIERDICGLPVLKASKEALDGMGGMAAAQRMIASVRMDDQAGVIIPMAYDEQRNPLVSFELLKAAGGKSTDIEAAIKRHNQEMFNTILAGFIEFGQVERGSHSLHMSATQIFAEAVGALMESCAAVMNRHAIPRLMAINGFDLALCPKLVPGEIGVRDIEELANYVSKLSTAGLTFFDKDTSTWLRRQAKMPAQSGDDSTMSHARPIDDPDDPLDAGDGSDQKTEDAGDMIEAAV